MAVPRIAWDRPTKLQNLGIRGLQRVDDLAVISEARLHRVSRAILDVGIPSVSGATTPKEDAIGLLMLAAEVEHALMSQYLYSAQSLKGHYARAVNTIAIQEMGHLITVQNLLLVLSGTNTNGIPSLIHMGRDGIRRASTRNPLPLVLEAISKDALAKYVVVERPQSITDVDLAARISELESHTTQLGISVNPVYALYAAIRWIFQADDEPDYVGLSIDVGFRPGWHLSDGDFVDRVIVDRFAAVPEEWGSIPQLIIEPVQDRAQSLGALDRIAAQGEGLPDAPDSHFSTFVELLLAYERGEVQVKPMPRTPRTPGQPASEDSLATEITNDYTVLWARLFDQCYELLLVDIAWAMCHERGPIRSDLVKLCIRTMSDVIQPIAKDLTARPLGDDELMKAGPAYALFDESIPDAPVAYRDRFDDCLARQRESINAISASPEFASDVVARLRLSAIEKIATEREPHLPTGA